LEVKVANEKKKGKSKSSGKRGVSRQFESRVNSKKKVSNRPKGVSPVASRGGEVDDIRRDLSSGSDRILALKDGDSVKVAFLEEADNALRYRNHSISVNKQFRGVPCGGEKCPICAQGSNPSSRALINVLDVKAKKIKLWPMSGETYSDVLTKFARRKTILDRYYTIIRQGTGTETKYVIEREDEKLPSSVKKLIDTPDKLLNGEQDLNNWLNSYYEAVADVEDVEDEDDEEFDDEDFDDDDDEDEDEDEDDEEEEDDEDEDDEDDEEEEDEDDEDEEILPPKKSAKKPVKKNSKKKGKK
jgi:hypothetical protein